MENKNKEQEEQLNLTTTDQELGIETEVLSTTPEELEFKLEDDIESLEKIDKKRKFEIFRNIRTFLGGVAAVLICYLFSKSHYSFVGTVSLVSVGILSVGLIFIEGDDTILTKIKKETFEKLSARAKAAIVYNNDEHSILLVRSLLLIIVFGIISVLC